jgi:hypothetical protein
MLEDSPQLDAIRTQARGEVDVRFIGVPSKRSSVLWYRGAIRPLKIGASVGHHAVTTGTLGAFVSDRATGAVLMLSNNHVLADENRAKPGDAILQPGKDDGGSASSHKAGAFFRAVDLKQIGANPVDAAVATLEPGVDYDAESLDGLGTLIGVGDALLATGDVSKIGRTTGATTGRITAFELADLVFAFGIGQIRFDNQREIEGAGVAPFSERGDSGALIVDADRRAVGLLFAGTNVDLTGIDRTYANPFQFVLDELKVDLHLG